MTFFMFNTFFSITLIQFDFYYQHMIQQHTQQQIAVAQHYQQQNQQNQNQHLQTKSMLGWLSHF